LSADLEADENNHLALVARYFPTPQTVSLHRSWHRFEDTQGGSICIVHQHDGCSFVLREPFLAHAARKAAVTRREEYLSLRRRFLAEAIQWERGIESNDAPTNDDC